MIVLQYVPLKNDLVITLIQYFVLLYCTVCSFYSKAMQEVDFTLLASHNICVEAVIQLSQADFRETEGNGTAIPVQVAKNVRLANPITFTVSPLQIGSSLLPDSIAANFGPENPFSPTRAGN